MMKRGVVRWERSLRCDYERREHVLRDVNQSSGLMSVRERHRAPFYTNTQTQYPDQRFLLDIEFWMLKSFLPVFG